MPVNSSSSADWMTIDEGMNTLVGIGKLPEEAAALIHRHLAAETLVARAASFHAEFLVGPPIHHFDWHIPAAIWNCCPTPPLGHPFWTVGDVQFQPPGVFDDLSLDCPPPTITIHGTRVSRDGLLAIARTVEGRSGRGRRKGVGGYAAADELLVLEMHKLVGSGVVTSAYQAALQLASQAKGGGTERSKAARLAKRYNQRFPKR